jgi:hypothetical protein
MNKRNIEYHNKLNAIFASSQPELEKLAAGFYFITQDLIAQSHKEQELLQAMGNREGLVKEQIKMSTIEHAVSIFDQCYQRVSGVKFQPTEEDDE